MAESQNSPFKRGEVVEQDAAKGRVKVKFSDEGDDTRWLTLNSQGSGGSKSFEMPEKGEQVHCLVDWNGEDGTVLGTGYSETDKSPTSDPNLITKKYADGSEESFNKSTGEKTINAKGGLTLTSGGVKFVLSSSGITITGGTINIS